MNASSLSTGQSQQGQRRRMRVLFFAEAVTLAHVARPLVLAQGLPESQYESILAADPRYERLYAQSSIPRIAINSIPSAQFAKALAKGNPIYTANELKQYVQQDLEVINDVAPDVIVGDMRLSLAASARLAGVPYLSLTNAYWSPHAQVHFPVPQTPMTRWLGVPLSQAIFNVVRPMVFALHAKPMNKVLAHHKLPSLGSNLLRVYSDADRVLYVDQPGLTPMAGVPATHHFLGPLLWEPDLPKPAWWESLSQTSSQSSQAKTPTAKPIKPIIYVNLGSSGPGNLLQIVIDGLKDLPVTVIAATAGKTTIPHPPANARIADFLPGLQACALADLVICNGGSPSTQQAIASGKPVLALPSNLDQFLNTQGLMAAGAAMQVRADQAKPAQVRHTAAAILADPNFRRQATALSEQAQACHAIDTFTSILQNVIGQYQPPTQPSAS